MGERFPISTAPLDGTRIRLFHEEELTANDKFPTFGHFDGKRWVMNQFFVFERGGHLLMARIPTHWAPYEPANPRTSNPTAPADASGTRPGEDR